VTAAEAAGGASEVAYRELRVARYLESTETFEQARLKGGS